MDTNLSKKQIVILTDTHIGDQTTLNMSKVKNNEHETGSNIILFCFGFFFFFLIIFLYRFQFHHRKNSSVQ